MRPGSARVAGLACMALKLLRLGLTIISWVCVALQAHSCMSKYLSEPTITNIYYESLDSVPQPVFSICKTSTVYIELNYENDFEREWIQGPTIPGHIMEKGLNYTQQYIYIMWPHTVRGWHHNQWELLYTHYSDILNYTYTVWPLDGSEVLVCVTVNIKNLSDYNILGFGTYPGQDYNTYDDFYLLYAHMPGQLLDMARSNARFPLDTNKRETYKASFTLNKQVSTRDNRCSYDSGYFDKCITEMTTKKLVKEINCTLAFLMTNNAEVCNASMVATAMEIFYFTFWNQELRSTHCQLPCHYYTLNVEYEEADNILQTLSDRKWDYFAVKYYQTMLRVLPQVKVVESTYSYNIISAIAELAGWMSLLIGFSFPQCLELLFIATLAFSQYFGRKFETFFKLGINCLLYLCYCLLVCLVVWEASVCIHKLSSNPVGVSLGFKSYSTVEKPVVTFCVTKEICTSSKFYGTRRYSKACPRENNNNQIHYSEVFPSYKMSSNEFWTNGTKMSSILSYVEVSKENGTDWETLWADDHTENMNSLFIKANISRERQVMMFCHSLDLNLLDQISALRFGVKTDVQFRVHKKGELNAHSFISQKSSLKLKQYECAYYFKDLTFSLKLTYMHKDDKPENYESKQSYDNCIQRQARSHIMKTKHCLLPVQYLEKQDFTQHGCHNVSEEQQSLKLYQSSFMSSMENTCKASEEWMNSELDVTEERNRGARNKCKNKQKFCSGKNKNKNANCDETLSTVTLVMPKFVKVFTTFRAYGFVNFVSEFGSWVGLFIGICLLDISSILSRWLKPLSELLKQKQKKKDFEQFGRLAYKLFCLFCFVCVAWQVMVCFIKYVSTPIATTISDSKDTSISQPGIALCHLFYYKHMLADLYIEGHDQGKLQQFDKKLLKEVKFYNDTAESWHSVWSANNSAMDRYFVWPRYNKKLYYICQELNLNLKEMNKARLEFEKDSKIHLFFYRRGHFFEDSLSTRIKIRLEQTIKTFSIQLDHYKLVSSPSFECEAKTYDYDHCLETFGSSKMIEKVGCVPPIFSNSFAVCSNVSLAFEALQVYYSAITTDYAGQQKACSFPCQFTDITLRLESKLTGYDDAYTVVKMPESITVVETFYSYTIVMVMAEFGGWLGLFLGIYLLQVNSLLQQVEKKLNDWISIKI